MTVALIALILPLCLDTFAVSTALGLGGLPPRRRLRTAVLFAAFEAAMPLIGLTVGRPLRNTIGDAGDYAAIALLALLAIYTLLALDEEDRVVNLAESSGPAIVALGLSVSLDELAIGFTLGLLRAPVLPVIILIALQAFIASQIGLRFGARLGAHARERAEKFAGLSLLALAAALLVTKLLAS
jgi:manganese efflux pump family protein